MPTECQKNMLHVAEVSYFNKDSVSLPLCIHVEILGHSKIPDQRSLSPFKFVHLELRYYHASNTKICIMIGLSLLSPFLSQAPWLLFMKREISSLFHQNSRNNNILPCHNCYNAVIPLLLFKKLHSAEF